MIKLKEIIENVEAADEDERIPIPQKILDAINKHVSKEHRQQVIDEISLDGEKYSYMNDILRIGGTNRHYDSPTYYYKGFTVGFDSGRFQSRFVGWLGGESLGRLGFRLSNFNSLRDWKQEVDEFITKRKI